jgi:hypothetical protein
MGHNQMFILHNIWWGFRPLAPRQTIIWFVPHGAGESHHQQQGMSYEITFMGHHQMFILHNI